MPALHPVLRRATEADGPAVRELVFGILWYYGLATDAHTDADLNDFAAHYFGRGGDFTVLTDGNGGVIGCVGLYRTDETTIELRKMYLASEWRGRGLGWKLL